MARSADFITILDDILNKTPQLGNIEGLTSINPSAGIPAGTDISRTPGVDVSAFKTPAPITPAPNLAGVSTIQPQPSSFAPASTTPVTPGIPGVGLGQPIDERSLAGPEREPVGLPQGELDLPTILGTLAAAIDPNTVGGRIGQSIVGLRTAEDVAAGKAEDRRLKELTASATIAGREATAKTGERTVGIKEDEVDRKSRVALLNSIRLSPVSDEATITQATSALQAIASPLELSQLGMVEKEFAPSFKIAAIQGTNDYGYFDQQGNVLKSPSGEIMKAPPPSTTVPSGTFLPTVDESGNVTYSFGATRGTGAGTIAPSTGVGIPATSIFDKQLEAAKSSLVFKEEEVTIENIAAEMGKLFPKSGKKKSIFADLADKKSKEKSDKPKAEKKDLVAVISPTGKPGKLPRKNLKAAIKAGYKEVK